MDVSERNEIDEFRHNKGLRLVQYRIQLLCCDESLIERLSKESDSPIIIKKLNFLLLKNYLFFKIISCLFFNYILNLP